MTEQSGGTTAGCAVQKASELDGWPPAVGSTGAGQGQPKGSHAAPGSVPWKERSPGEGTCSQATPTCFESIAVGPADAAWYANLLTLGLLYLGRTIEHRDHQRTSTWRSIDEQADRARHLHATAVRGSGPGIRACMDA